MGPSLLLTSTPLPRCLQQVKPFGMEVDICGLPSNLRCIERMQSVLKDGLIPKFHLTSIEESKLSKLHFL
jgi:hypothetical protein